MVPGFQFRQSFATLSGLVFNDDNRRATANICVCAAKILEEQCVTTELDAIRGRNENFRRMFLQGN